MRVLLRTQWVSGSRVANAGQTRRMRVTWSLCNHEAHGPTDYTYICYHIQQTEAIPVDLHVCHVCSDFSNRFLNIHTNLVSLDPSFFFNMHVNGNFNSNYHVYVHVIQRMEREGSSHTRLCIHTHECKLWLYRDMMSILYMLWYRIEISHYRRLTCGPSNSRHTMYYDTHTRTIQRWVFP